MGFNSHFSAITKALKDKTRELQRYKDMLREANPTDARQSESIRVLFAFSQKGPLV